MVYLWKKWTKTELCAGHIFLFIYLCINDTNDLHSVCFQNDISREIIDRFKYFFMIFFSFLERHEKN